MLATLTWHGTERGRQARRKETCMRTLPVCIVVLGLLGSRVFAADQHPRHLNGAWNVSVTIRNCETGEVIRRLRALNLFVHDGSMTETSSNIMRGPSVGTWRFVQDDTYTSMFEFFRFNPDGTFASTARVIRTIELSEDGTRFTSTGTVEDFNAQDVRVSVGCATETAARAQ
jgi:hypothetical protein